MSISDNARERARIARLKALESEERVQKYGDLSDSRVTVINYDPDRGYLVRALNGEVGYATNISGTQLGVGATVQATRKGNGFIIDYFDTSSGKGNDSDSNGLAKQAFGDVSTVNTNGSPIWLGFGGLDPNNSVVGYKPDGKGGCDVKTYSKDKDLPEGVYATAKECQDSQKEGSFKCVEGGGCIEVTDGSGKYKTKAECEKDLLPSNFSGGQCRSIVYYIEQANLSTTWGVIGAGVGPIKSISLRGTPQQVWVNDSNGERFVALGFVDGSNSFRVRRADNLEDNCGNPKGRCPG